MRVLHINTNDHGGAGIAVIRQHKALLENGVESYLMTLNKTCSDIPNHMSYSDLIQTNTSYSINNKKSLNCIKINNINKKIRLKKEIRKRIQNDIYQGPFSFIDNNYDINRIQLTKEVDIINLHWVSNFLNWKTFFKKNIKPLVWTLHDMEPFTGGYHYSGGFDGYKRNDIEFPPLINTKFNKIAYKNLKNKRKLLKKKEITIVANSNWLAARSKESALFNKYPTQTIYLSVDFNIYKILKKEKVRKKYGLIKNKNIILVAAQNIRIKRKGFLLFLESLNILRKYIKEITVCTVGRTDDTIISNRDIINYGFVSNEMKLSELYNAADVFVLPSIEESFGQTAIEALACGIPVVGYPIGGVKETIIHKYNGEICEKIDSHALALNILKVLNNKERYNRKSIRQNAKKKYDLNIQAAKYISVYNKILKDRVA